MNDTYAKDFYVWSLQQAQELRELPHADNRLDRERIAEEIEDLGRSERFACEAHVERIVEHLLKLEHSGSAEPAHSWKREVWVARKNLAKHSTPAIERLLRAGLAQRYADGRALAAFLENDVPGFAARLPEQCPYSFEQVAGDWLPEPSGRS